MSHSSLAIVRQQDCAALIRIELRIEDALAIVARFAEETALADAPVATGSSESAGALRAVLLILKSQDGGTVRASDIGSVLEDPRQQSLAALPIRASSITQSLSSREHSVLRSMSRGLSNKRIAQELHIAPETVKSHVKGIFVKLAVQTRAHAVSTAGALGLL